jgi:hypothetical protein
MNLHSQIKERLTSELSTSGGDDVAQLNNSLRLLAKWRSALIQNTVIHHTGSVVWQGPFQGLDFLPQSTEGCHVAKLLGTYEQPLQPYIEQAMKGGYSTILNIGCAEGYYAVGMACRMPQTQVLAFDTNPSAQSTCASLAKKNQVLNRVQAFGHFSRTDFSLYSAHEKVLVLCDIEGAELELLDPMHAPALRELDLIIESHECLIPGVTQALLNRFSESHNITIIQDNGQRTLLNAPAWFNQLAHLDQLLATWEWRSGPTPWLVMHKK